MPFLQKSPLETVILQADSKVSVNHCLTAIFYKQETVLSGNRNGYLKLKLLQGGGNSPSLVEQRNNLSFFAANQTFEEYTLNIELWMHFFFFFFLFN